MTIYSSKQSSDAIAESRCPFPYTMGLHQSPLPPTNPDDNVAQVHLHFYPPLLRSASVRKFMVGFELMGECQVSWLCCSLRRLS
jgi:galactose-1-phosphate uridylyltransferase